MLMNRILALYLLTVSTTSLATDLPCRVSKVGVELVKSFEGLQQNAYWDHNAWAVGYGARGKGIGPKTWWTKTQSEIVLEMELEVFAALICKERTIRTQGELDALVSLAYNTGFYRLKKNGFLAEKNTSRLIKRWKLYVKSGGVTLNGLKRRRLAEIKVFQDAN